MEVESLLIRTKCQFVDITRLRHLPSSEKQLFEMKSHHIPSHNYTGQILNGNVISTVHLVYFSDSYLCRFGSYSLSPHPELPLSFTFLYHSPSFSYSSLTLFSL